MAPLTHATSTITSYFQPKTASKRRSVDSNGSEKENSIEPCQKKFKPSTATAKPKTVKSPTPKKSFNDTVKIVAREVKKLDKAVKNMDPNDKYGLNVGDYVDIAVTHLDDVESLAGSDVMLAWNLLLLLGDVAAADMGRHFRMCGYGDHEHGFKELDKVMLELIEKMKVPEKRVEGSKEVRQRWTSANADVGEFKTGRPNKQQRNLIDNQRIEWEEERRQARVKRRAGCEDWLIVSLADLKAERDYLDKYGVEGFFVGSIAKLEGLDQVRKDDSGEVGSESVVVSRETST
jgi:hypothetical protein